MRIGLDVDFSDRQRVDQREAQRHVDRDIAAQPAMVVERFLGQAELRPRQEADHILRRAGDRQANRCHLRRRLVESRQVDRTVGDRQVDRVAALHVEMNRPALVSGLAGHVPDLGHVRHVAHGQAAIVEEGRHPVDFHVRNVADGRTQGELRRQVDGAAAHVGERPLPASFGKAQRPVVAQPVDGDLPDLGAAGEMALLVRAPPRPRDHDLGGSEIEIDPIDLRGVLHIVDAELRRHGMDLMGRRQDARQGDAAVVAADVDGDVPDLSIAGPVDQKPPSQGDIDPAQDGQIRGKIGEDPGLEARDPGLQRDAAAITRVGAGKRQIDRVAMSLEAGIGGYEDADGVAPELRIGIWRRPRETCLQVPENDVRPLDQHRI